MKKKYKLQDSGARKKIKGGGYRDRAKGKGRFDLISPFALRRLADVYEKGAEKFDDRNWEQGLPFSWCIDSALRHIAQYMMGMEDEDHIGQAAWNLFAIMHFQELERKDLDDLPHYLLKETMQSALESTAKAMKKFGEVLAKDNKSD
jgi:cytochrome P450